MENQPNNKNIYSKLEKSSAFKRSIEIKELNKIDYFEKEKKVTNYKQENKIESSDIQTIPQKNNLVNDIKLEKEIEDILSENLIDLYKNLDQSKKIIFKQKGEQTATTIAIIFKSIKFKVYEILKLIRNWLFLIPGINKFFLEQEAKIKTDKILQLNSKTKNLYK